MAPLDKLSSQGNLVQVHPTCPYLLLHTCRKTSCYTEKNAVVRALLTFIFLTEAREGTKCLQEPTCGQAVQWDCMGEVKQEVIMTMSMDNTSMNMMLIATMTVFDIVGYIF